MAEEAYPASIPPDQSPRSAAKALQAPADDLEDDDLAAIAESEAQIQRGEDLDWKVVSAQFRRRYLGEKSPR